MNIRTLAPALIALCSVAAFAADAPAGRSLELGEMVAAMESRYPGKVIAITLDTSGDKAPHYHVDMLFPRSEVVRADVDAVTLALASRDHASLDAGSATLADATALVAQAVPGQLLVAEFDAASGASAHYDIDVRLPRGAVARLKVDPATRQIGWRSPAIVND